MQLSRNREKGMRKQKSEKICALREKKLNNITQELQKKKNIYCTQTYSIKKVQEHRGRYANKPARTDRN